jgi:DNA-binding response OmpR family regulator
VKPPTIILIADRNPYVRKFMQREMTHAGYEVLLAESGRQLLFWIERHTALDLVILDSDLPDMDAAALIAELRMRCPDLPVVVHCHPGDETEKIRFNGIWFVQKGGNSVERIIHMVERILSIHSLER